MDILFLAITQPFLDQSGWIFCGNSGNYYLSIASVKSMLWDLTYDFKKLALVGVLLGHSLSKNRVSKLSDPELPLKRDSEKEKLQICASKIVLLLYGIMY